MGIETNWAFARATGGAGAIAAAFLGVDHVIIVDQIHLHADAAMADENMIVEIDSAIDVAYDAHLDAFSTNGITNHTWIPGKPIPIAAGEVLDVNCANTNNVTWGLTLCYRHNV